MESQKNADAENKTVCNQLNILMMNQNLVMIDKVTPNDSNIVKEYMLTRKPELLFQWF